ncbi:hypothetical protein [Aliamphritea spongicola]|nr:hypothetical protein [Aliamphritea spongicola]
MADGVTKLEGKLKDAEAEYQQALQANEASQASTAAPAPAAPAFSQAQLDDLKADADAMRSKVEKAKAAYEKAVASESPAAAKMADGVAKLEGKLKEAEAEYQQALQANQASTETAAPAINNVAVEKPDAKALKQQVSIMRTKLKKQKKRLMKRMTVTVKTCSRMLQTLPHATNRHRMIWPAWKRNILPLQQLKALT